MNFIEDSRWRRSTGWSHQRSWKGCHIITTAFPMSSQNVFTQPPSNHHRGKADCACRLRPKCQRYIFSRPILLSNQSCRTNRAKFQLREGRTRDREWMGHRWLTLGTATDEDEYVSAHSGWPIRKRWTGEWGESSKIGRCYLLIY